jgi:hypothetical protein
MKIFIQTTKDEIVTEKEVVNILTAKIYRKDGEKIHVCRHEEGLPCSLE